MATKAAKSDELVLHWRTIGPVEWAEGAYGWIGVDGAPVTLEPWQRSVLEAWWERRETVTTLAISNIKKTGKTFVDAVLLCWRWLALPGQHFAAGNDLDQSAGRQFEQIREMVKRNEYLKRNTTIHRGALIFRPTGSTITALAVDACGNAGSNHLTASHTEAWGVIYEGGIRAYEELTPPPGRFYGLPALRIADSYAGFESESQTWHDLVDRGLKGERASDDWPIYRIGGLLLFHMAGEEAQRRCFRGSPAEAAAYYADQRTTLRPGTFQRLHENQRATGQEVFIDLASWDACVDEAHRPLLPVLDEDGQRLAICVGVDAATKHDSASVIATLYDQERGRVVLARSRTWQPSAEEPLDIDHTIGDFLRELHAGYRLIEVRYDPYQLHDLSMRLKAEGLPMVEFPQTVPNLTVMGSNLFELIQGRNLVLYRDAPLRTAAGVAVALETPRGWRIAKEKSAHKIDPLVALAMAALAAIEVGDRPAAVDLIAFV